MRSILPVLLVLTACKADPSDDLDPGAPLPGLLGQGLLDPFPNAALIGADGRLAIPLEAMPEGPATPVPLERLAWRTGFSPAQPSVVRLPDVDAAALPGFDAPTPGLGGVRMFDLTTGEALPVMAELDAWPDQAEPALLVRPLIYLEPGHRIAVVVTTEAAPRPERFDRLVRGDTPPGLEGQAEHYADLVARIVDLGVPLDQIALAWDFPIGDGTRPLRSATEQIALDGAFSLPRVRDLDAGDVVAPYTWRVAQGTFTTQDFLVDDLLLSMNPDGTVSPTGTTQAELYVHVPTSVADAPAGSVPVMIFGHGIFGEPTGYLDSPTDKDGVLKLAEDLGMVVVASAWRGLTYKDRVEVIQAAQDFGRMPVVSDRLVQGQVNTMSLAELVRSPAFVEHPALQGRQGQPLLDGSRLYYYGISLGGIQGMVLLAQDVGIDAAVAHVGGSMWSTMLERSSNWVAFELFITNNVAEPADRQLLYAVSQLFWDPADPIAWVPELRDKSFILQVAMGDEQVPNFTSDTIARSVGMPLLGPAVSTPWGFDVVGDQPPGSAALVQLDPEVPYPAPVNRPASITRAHDLPRTWLGTHRQTVDHLTPGQEGRVVHHCGDAPCSASNPGD